MVEITRWVDLDMGHRVPDHGSKCRNLHGHRYRVEVTVTGPVIFERGDPEDGMITDFACLKTALDEVVHDPCDHGMILASHDPWVSVVKELDTKLVVVDFPPTAEMLAHWWGRALQRRLHPLEVRKVQVWETEKSTAVWAS